MGLKKMTKAVGPVLGGLFRRRKGAAVLAAILASLLPAAAAPAFAGAADPAGFITSIYAGGHEEAVWTQWLSAAKRGVWFTRDTAALWGRCDAKARKSKDEQGPLDADIATNSQLGWEDYKGFKVSVVSQGADRAAVDARMEPAPNTVPPKVDSDNVIRYDLVRENNAWRIGDVRSTVDGKPWSLRQILKDYLKN